MHSIIRAAQLVLVLAAVATLAAAERKEFRYNVGPGTWVSIENDNGPVVVRPSGGRQVVITATTHSPDVEVDSQQRGNRVEARTHVLKPGAGDHNRVEMEVSIPADASLVVRASTGPIQVERLRGDLTLEGDSARIEVRDVANGHVHARTISGPIVLSKISNGHVEVGSVSGELQLVDVSGPKVTVTSTKGNIRYNGDFASAGAYEFSNGSGSIDLSIPTSASMLLRANSVKGTVESDFPLKPDEHLKAAGGSSSLLGTSNAGASSVSVRSLSGKIRVKRR